MIWTRTLRRYKQGLHNSRRFSFPLYYSFQSFDFELLYDVWHVYHMLRDMNFQDDNTRVSSNPNLKVQTDLNISTP